MMESFREATSFGKDLKNECGKVAATNDVRTKGTRQKALALPMRT
jgi:hypothetical protein